MNKLRNSTILLSLLFLPFFLSTLLSQDEIRGDFQINNYSKVLPDAGPQNWEAACLENGIMVFANNGGLLKFDGVHWSLHALPNKTIARSLCIADEKIFVGGQDEIGYFDQQYQFHSIRHRIPSSELPLEDIWQLLNFNGEIYFRSVNKVFKYNLDLDTVQVIDPLSVVISIMDVNDELYFHDLFRGLVNFADTAKIYESSEFFKGKSLLNVVAFQEKLLFLTETQGIFILDNEKFIPLNTQLNDYLEKNLLYNAAVVSQGELFLGTQFDGLIAIDSIGQITQKIRKSNGLINNNVQTMSLDSISNLWVGTANGIANVNINSHLRVLQPDSEESSTFYDVLASNEQIYFASNNGVFVCDDQTNAAFSLVKNSEGQAWGLDKADDLLLLGHNRGAFSIEDRFASSLSENPGAWKFVATDNSNYFYVGTYTGVDIYRKSNNGLEFHKKLKGFIESSRIMMSVYENELWVSHPYRGVYKITHDDNFDNVDVTAYGENKGLSSSLLNYLFEIDQEPVVTAAKGIYRYDRKLDQFEYDTLLNTYIDTSQNVRRLFQDTNNDIWFIAENEVGVLKREGTGCTKEIYPELVNKFVGGFETLEFVDSNRVFICTDQNILVLNRNQVVQTKKPKINITEIRLTDNDSILYSNEARLAHNENAIQFMFSSPSHGDGISYQYNLQKDGTDHWSTWTKETKKEFNNLQEGNYRFQVRALATDRRYSDTITFDFKVLPIWYLSYPAKLLYMILVFAFLLGLFLIPRKKYNREKEVLIEAVNQSEEELQKIKTEQLSAELASSTLHLVQKNETINKIRAELTNYREKVKDPSLKRELKKVMSVVNDDEQLEDDWERFSTHFDQVHTNFLSRISDEFPNITPKDLKLCAYLRMNLTTKEIAPLLHISVRGVEISRYRLRKKLNLSSEINLSEFMINY